MLWIIGSTFAFLKKTVGNLMYAFGNLIELKNFSSVSKWSSNVKSI